MPAAAAEMTPEAIVMVVPSGLTTPKSEVVAVPTEISAVLAPPEEWMGVEPVTAVTPVPPVVGLGGLSRAPVPVPAPLAPELQR